MLRYFKFLFFILIASSLFTSCIVSKKKYDEATKRADQEQAENGKLRGKVAELESIINKLKANINELKGNITKQKSTIEALNEQVTTLQDSIKANEDKITSLKGQLGNLGAEKQKNLKELADTKDQIASQKKSLEDLESRRKQMEKELEGQKQDLENQKKQLEAQVAAQRTQLEKLQSFIDQQQKATEELRKKIASALEGFNSNELTVTRKNGKVYISMQEGLLFPSGSAVVNKKGKEALAKVASVLNTNADINIDVEGHTDSIAIHNKNFADNWELSTARATSIAHVLIDEYQVSPVKLVASGRSQYDPVAPNTTPEGRAANRRTEIILEPKLDEIMQMLNGK